jgi:hypothetical protein
MKRTLKKTFQVLVILCLSLGFLTKAEPVQAVATIAFPDVEGYGKNSIGGRTAGVQIVQVTSLNDSGAGTLRNALETVTTPRIVIFKIGGVIDLSSSIEIDDPYVYVAGQTAPGNGIVLRDGGIEVCTHNVILRGMRIRPADRPDALGSSELSTTRSGIRLSESCSEPGDFPHDVVLDHNSVSWGIDGGIDIWGENINDVTVSYNIVAEQLDHSVHIDEGKTDYDPHSTGSIVGQPVNDSTNPISNISLYRNAYLHNRDRNILNRGHRIEFVNNYIYNWGTLGTQLGDTVKDTITVPNDNLIAQYFAAVGNMYVEGPNTRDSLPGSNPIRINDTLDPGTRVYLRDNISEYRTSVSSGSDWDQVYCEDPAECWTYPTYPFTAQVAALSPAAAYAEIRDHAGARWPVVDAVDDYLIDDITAASNVASPGAAVGSTLDCINYCDENPDPQDRITRLTTWDGTGLVWATHWPTSTANPTDTDSDGMPDTFEDGRGLNKNSAADALTYSSAGYLWIEEYVNSIISGTASGGGGAAPYLDTQKVYSVAASAGDAEEASNGTVTLSDADLDLGQNLLGLRFSSVDIANGANITAAYVRFFASRFDNKTTTIRGWGEDVDDCAAFAATANNVSNRNQTKTSARMNQIGQPAFFGVVPWVNDPSVETGDFGPVVDEIVSRGGWASGNDLCLVLWADGSRSFRSYDWDANFTDTDDAPQLVVFTDP